MIRVLVHDKRLGGGKPPSDRFDAMLQVDRRDPLAFILGWVQSKAKQFGYIDELHLYAHGIEKGGKLGFGVLLGADNITHLNVHQWGVLDGWVEWIQLLACGAASTQSGSGGQGDGMTLCSYLAGYSRSWLTASMDKQIYMRNVFGEIEMGGWEGRVYSWDPWGTLYCQGPLDD